MRARNLKPGFFKNLKLSTLPALTRLLFEGLWCMSDREGRLVDQPRRIKAEILPYDNCNVEKMLRALQDSGFIQRYSANGEQYIQVLQFKKHQNPHVKEVPTTIPAPDEHQASTVLAPGQTGTSTEVARLNPESLFLDSLDPKEAAAAIAREAENPESPPQDGSSSDSDSSDDPLLWELWEIPGWDKNADGDAKRLAWLKDEYPAASPSTIIAQVKAKAEAGTLKATPWEAVIAFAKQEQGKAPPPRPKPKPVKAPPPLPPEEEGRLALEQAECARRAREQAERDLREARRQKSAAGAVP
jgi:hypothetical protein